MTAVPGAEELVALPADVCVSVDFTLRLFLSRRVVMADLGSMFLGRRRQQAVAWLEGAGCACASITGSGMKIGRVGAGMIVGACA